MMYPVGKMCASEDFLRLCNQEFDDLICKQCLSKNIFGLLFEALILWFKFSLLMIATYRKFIIISFSQTKIASKFISCVSGLDVKYFREDTK